MTPQESLDAYTTYVRAIVSTIGETTPAEAFIGVPALKIVRRGGSLAVYDYSKHPQQRLATFPPPYRSMLMLCTAHITAGAITFVTETLVASDQRTACVQALTLARDYVLANLPSTEKGEN